LKGLDLSAEQARQLLTVDVAGWKNEIANVATNYEKFGKHLPAALTAQLEGLRQRLG